MEGGATEDGESAQLMHSLNVMANGYMHLANYECKKAAKILETLEGEEREEVEDEDEEEDDVLEEWID